MVGTYRRTCGLSLTVTKICSYSIVAKLVTLGTNLRSLVSFFEFTIEWGFGEELIEALIAHHGNDFTKRLFEKNRLEVNYYYTMNLINKSISETIEENKVS